MTPSILIRGPLGVGKTTIAKKLAEILNGEHISVDEVLAENGLDKVDEKLGCIPPENFIKADELILPLAKEKLQNGTPVIFDACFYHKEHIEHLLKNLPEPHFIFDLKAPLETCMKRDKGRKKSYGEGAAIAVHSLVSRFDYGTRIETEDKSVDETMEEIMGYLK